MGESYVNFTSNENRHIRGLPTRIDTSKIIAVKKNGRGENEDKAVLYVNGYDCFVIKMKYEDFIKDMGMKKYIILSVNDNPDYLYFTPITCWAWRKFGWEPIIMYHGNKSELMNLIYNTFEVLHKDMTAEMKSLYRLKWNTVFLIYGYRSDTITQVSRLYASCVVDGYLMTGDIDMIPLSDYWQPNENIITSWGHDLTNYEHYPICYIGMSSEKWREVMKIDSNDYNALIKRDLDRLPQARSANKTHRWVTDQDLITELLRPFKPKVINRGTSANGYPRGRVDRSSWDWSISRGEFIDCHLFHQIYHKGNENLFDKTMSLLGKIWTDEDFGWFVDYHNRFKKLTGQS